MLGQLLGHGREAQFHDLGLHLGVGLQHTVEDAADLGVEVDSESQGVLVDLFQPAGEPGKDTFKFRLRGLAFPQVLLEATGEFLVAQDERGALPGLRVVHALGQAVLVVGLPLG